MGSVSTPSVSILQGQRAQLSKESEPITLHRILENTVDVVEKISQNNNNEVKIIHSINIKESIGQQTALISGSNKLSFSCLNESSNRLARAILKSLPDRAKKGNSDGDVLIATCIQPSEALIITLTAIWKVGAAYLPLDTQFPKNRIDHILKESEPVMMIVDDFEMGEEFGAIKYGDLKKLGEELSSSNIPETETLTYGIPKIQLLAAVLYTSGSTGVPKGVRIPHSAILNRMKWQFKTFPYSPSERVCAFKTALTFVDSICELWGPLLNARTVLIIPKEDTKNPEKLTNLLEEYEVERIVLVPTLLQAILMYGSVKKSREFLKNLRLWVCSGENLSVSLAKQFFECFGTGKHVLCNFYGSTEIMGDVTYHVIRGKEELETNKTVPIGKPVDNCNIYILNKNLCPVNAGTIGELYVSGFNLACGYVRGRDSDRFTDNPLTIDFGHSKLYRTGDYARIHENIVYYEGRTDSQIKVRGHRVDLSEIESTMAKINELDKYTVLSYKPGEVNQELVAFVTIKSKITGKEIENKLKKMLPSYMIPQVVIVDTFPLLVNGKVDRQSFLKMHETENDSCSRKVSETDYRDIPDAKMEKAKVLFETISKVLGKSLRSSIDAKSNFYCLGGNSLNSVFTVTQLNDLGYGLSISDFISSKTLLDVIDKMEENGKCERTNEPKPTMLDLNYRTELFQEKHKNDVFEIITNSFYEKADLERLLDPPVILNHYTELLELLWPHLLEKNLSFVAIDSENNVLGAALNFDAFDEPDIELSPSNNLNVVLEFLEFLEGPIRNEKLPNGKNKVLHSFMMGSRPTLSPQETIRIFYFMEEEIIKFAKKLKFEGVFTSNTNPLTQQLGCNVNNYETFLNYQVNQYVMHDGRKPFAKAADSQRTIVSWKKV